jgi:hypothetical protein
MSQDAQNKLLAADLEKADPTVYNIVQKVRGIIVWVLRTGTNAIAGETQTEALHQPYSLRELHESGCAGCAWKCYAEYVAYD